MLDSFEELCRCGCIGNEQEPLAAIVRFQVVTSPQHKLAAAQAIAKAHLTGFRVRRRLYK